VTAQAVELTCHPRTRAEAVRTIHADLLRAPDGRLRLTYVLAGDIARIRVPPFRGPHSGTELWRHTCFEAFIAADGAAAYHELNLAPSGAWAALAFRRYREAEPVAPEVPTPHIVVRTTPDRLVLDALVAVDGLSPAYAHAPLRLALATVVEETSGAASYWSLHHPAGGPDFHHTDAFVLRLEPPVAAC
jgi:hypothetical protein